MPVFPGLVSHNNANRPVLDATSNQIKGFGFFDSATERSALNQTIQTRGFLAVTQVSDQYKAFVYTGDDWNDSTSWTEISGGSIPGGSKYAVLSKVSDVDNDFSWTEAPQFESVTVSKYSISTAPSINLFRSRGSDHTATETQSGDVIAEIGFSGVSIGGGQAAAGKFVFTQVDHAGYGPGVSTKMDVFVGSDSGDIPAMSINEDRVLSLAVQSTTPAAVSGGLYINAQNQLFLGVE